jgi:mannose/fructose/N-acetylgalactosamine-specific phosphotransferase system component IID
MSAETTGPPRAVLTRVAAGTLVLQASFNGERRQGLGVAAALAPAAGFWPGNEDRRAFFRRHLENFNTNPAMAGPILGAVVRLEERAARGDAPALARVPRVKKALEGPFAAAGDTLLWSGARPVSGHLGSAVALVAGGWGAMVFLVLYNAVHLGLRVGGVFWGYRWGEDVHRLLASPRLRAATAAVPGFVLVTAGLLGAVALVSPAGSAGPALLGGVAMGLGWLLGRRGFTRGTLLAVGAMIIGLTAALIFRNGIS